MVGGGLHKFEDSVRDTASVMPANADWIKDRAVEFRPEQNKVITNNGEVINLILFDGAASIMLIYLLPSSNSCSPPIIIIMILLSCLI